MVRCIEIFFIPTWNENGTEKGLNHFFFKTVPAGQQPCYIFFLNYKFNIILLNNLYTNYMVICMNIYGDFIYIYIYKLFKIFLY